MKKTDVLIIGGGIAGLTAAIYTSRAGLSTTIIENNIPGGQIANAFKIENYPGFLSISGGELTQLLLEQTQKSGAFFEEFDPIIDFDLQNKTITTQKSVYLCRTIIIASGSVPRKLSVTDSEQFEGKGIHYCAVCDGAFYKGKNVVVVGGGNSAVEGALFLSELADKITILVRGDKLKAEKSRIDSISRKSNITVRFGTEIEKLQGTDSLEGIVTKKNETINCDGIFVFIGSEAASELFKSQIKTDQLGYIVTDENMCTSIGGVFAAGDIRSKEVRQLTTAAADGTIAALSAQKYLIKD